MVVGPWGQIIAQCQDGEDFAVADLDFEYLEEVRRRLPGTGKAVITTIG
jgi:predicted amidohydrolase